MALRERTIMYESPRVARSSTRADPEAFCTTAGAGEVLRPFSLVMTFGIFVATFSSIYVASPVLLYIERKFPRKDLQGRGSHVSASQARAESEADAPRPIRGAKTPAGR